jgi:hypothetical protein
MCFRTSAQAPNPSNNNTVKSHGAGHNVMVVNTSFSKRLRCRVVKHECADTKFTWLPRFKRKSCKPARKLCAQTSRLCACLRACQVSSSSICISMVAPPGISSKPFSPYPWSDVTITERCTAVHAASACASTQGMKRAMSHAGRTELWPA